MQLSLADAFCGDRHLLVLEPARTLRRKCMSHECADPTHDTGQLMKISFILNGREVSCDVDPQMPLLWVIREVMALTGTKFGCGMAQCGACTVHVDGEAIRACVIPVSAVKERSVTTIEGISGHVSKAVQVSWRRLDVPQCGYCQSGQIMSAVALLQRTPKPTDADIDEAMSGNICRCGTYQRIRAGIHEAVKALEA